LPWTRRLLLGRTIEIFGNTSSEAIAKEKERPGSSALKRGFIGKCARARNMSERGEALHEEFVDEGVW